MNGRLIILSFLLLSACDSKVNEKTGAAKAENYVGIPAGGVNGLSDADNSAIDSNNPAEVQRRFRAVIDEAIVKAGPGLKTPYKAKDHLGEVHSYWSEYNGEFKFDIERTNSIVTPYIGVVSWGVDWYHNNKLTDFKMFIEAKYSYQDGKWVFKKLSRYDERGYMGADEYVLLFQ